MSRNALVACLFAASFALSAGMTAAAAQSDTLPPALSVSSLPDGAVTSKPTLNVSGVARDDSGLLSVTVNGEAVATDAGGAFSTAVPLRVGGNAIAVVASDAAGNRQSDLRTVMFDPAIPLLTILSPADNSATAQPYLAVTGTVSEASSVTVTDQTGDSHSAAVSGNAFVATVNLLEGVNTISVTVADFAGNTSTAKRTVTCDSGRVTLSVTSPGQDITTGTANLVLRGSIVDAIGTAAVSISMDGRTFSPVASGGAFEQALTFSEAKKYPITVTVRDEAGYTSSVIRNVIYQPGSTGSETPPAGGHPFGWTNPAASHRDYVSSNGVSGCISCHSIAQSSKGQAMSCYNCHGQKWDTPSGGSTGGSTGGTSGSHPFGWTNPRSSHQDYADENGVGSCISCHSISESSKGQAMSCYNCHGKEWDTPSGGSTGGSTGGGTSGSHPFGWTNPRSSHQDYADENGVGSCISCHSISESSKGQAMSCYNCHGKEWDTPSGGSTGGSTGGTSGSHPFGWTNPRSSHQDYADENGVGSCISCHSISESSKGQAMSCYNCHGKEWDSPSGGSTGGTTGGTTSGHPFGWSDPEESHRDYVEDNGTSGCTSCHSTSESSKGQAMSCYNCHGKEW